MRRTIVTAIMTDVTTVVPCSQKISRKLGEENYKYITINEIKTREKPRI